MYFILEKVNEIVMKKLFKSFQKNILEHTYSRSLLHSKTWILRLLEFLFEFKI